MSLSREAMLELMAYADGELDAEAHARVEELLRTSEEARGVLDAMGTLGEVVREGVEARAGESAVADGIADGVMEAIARETNVADGGAGENVVPLAEARRARGGMATAAIAVLALAAGALFLVRGKAPAPVASEVPLEPTPSAIAVPSATEPEAPAPVAQAQAEETGVDLEEAHSTRNKVNVFFVPSPSSPSAAASVVVWIDDRHGGH